MSALLAADDVARYLGRDFSIAERAQCEEIIADLQNELEQHLNTPLTVRSFTETQNMPPSQRILFLEHGPIVAIQSLKVDGALIDAQDYVVQPWGVQDLLLVPSNVAGQPPKVDVIYTAGIDAASLFDFPLGVFKRAVAREMNRTKDDTVGVSTISTEGYAVKYDGTGGWTDDDLKKFDRYRRQGAWTQPTVPTVQSAAWASRTTPW